MSHPTAHPDALARDLARLLTDLAGLHGELAAHLRDKLDAMRKADSDRMARLTARELLLVEKVEQREGLRRQITRRIAEAAGLGRGRADALRASELAELFPEPRRSHLLTAASGLRRAVEEVQRLQRTSVLVTNEMLKHLSDVVAVMCGADIAAESYTRGGRRAPQRSASVFEAVG